jgi:hypothetical protein
MAVPLELPFRVNEAALERQVDAEQPFLISQLAQALTRDPLALEVGHLDAVLFDRPIQGEQL